MTSESMPVLRRLYDQYGALVYSAAATILRDHDLAEDAAQEVWLRAARAVRRGFTPEFPASYLLTITRREARRIRSRPRTAPIEGTTPLAPPQADSVIRTEEERRLRAALLALPEPERRVFLLTYLADLDWREICRRLALSRSTYFRKLSETEERLKAQLSR